MGSELVEVLDPGLLPVPDAGAVLDDLRRLAVEHGLRFRLEVGRAILDSFYGGDAEAYHSFDANKAAPFSRFLSEHAAALAELELGAATLRRCVRAHLVVAELSAEQVAGLVFSHLVELAKVDDAATRALLAHQAVAGGWTVVQLRDAALSVKQGRWIDSDLETPGLQPGAPPEPEPSPPRAGHVINRFVRVADGLGELAGQWGAVEVERLSRVQKQRMAEALDAVEARIAVVRARLG